MRILKAVVLLTAILCGCKSPLYPDRLPMRCYRVVGWVPWSVVGDTAYATITVDHAPCNGQQPGNIVP